MNICSNEQVLRAWEAGSVRQGVARTIAVLAAVYGQPEDQLVHLPLGVRNRLLLELYESAFGSELRGFTTCPACSESLELTLPVSALRAGFPAESAEAFEVISGDLALTLRLPDSSDIAAASAASDVELARQALIDRCVVRASRGGQALSAAADLTKEEVALAGDEIARRDPLVETTLQLRCAECGNVSESVLDIGAFVWVELSALARRLMREVHQLARAYGWPEQDVLRMSAVRRQFYLELVYS